MASNELRTYEDKGPSRSISLSATQLSNVEWSPPTYTLSLSSSVGSENITYDLTISSDSGNSQFDVNTIDSLALWGVSNPGSIFNDQFFSDSSTSFELVDNGINPDGYNYTLNSGGSGASSISVSWTVTNPDAWVYGNADLQISNRAGQQINLNFGNVPIGAVPEPAAYPLIAGGLVALATALRRRKK
jgi:hypothetical protein